MLLLSVSVIVGISSSPNAGTSSSTPSEPFFRVFFDNHKTKMKIINVSLLDDEDDEECDEFDDDESLDPAGRCAVS